jgi:two-component system alkaline phosphatase synthesis response regulator PhoP/two-component system response regulator VicR
MPHLLLVEDNQHIQRIYSAKLEMEGFKVTTAEDGVQGLALAASCPPDIILLDIMLPKMDGFDVLQRMRDDATLRQIPVYILSNRGWAEDVQRALALGARQFFSKGSSSVQHIVTQIRTECGFKKVMIISPNIMSAKVLRSALEHPRILCAANTTLMEAAGAIERGAPDLVVLDARNITSQILSVLQHLHSNTVTSAIHVIAVTDEPDKIQRADEYVPSAQIGAGLMHVVLKWLGLTDAAEPVAVAHAPLA